MKLQNWRHWKTSKGLCFGFGFPLLILVVLIIVSYWQIQEASDDLDQIVQVQAPLEQSLLQMRVSVAETSRAVMDYSQDRDPTKIDRASSSEADFEDALAELIDRGDKGEIGLIGQQLADLHDEFTRSRYQIMSLVDQQENELSAFLEDMEEVGDLVDSKLRAPIESNDPDAVTKLEASFGLELSVLAASSAIESYTIDPNTALKSEIENAQEAFRGYMEMYQSTKLSVYAESWLSEIDQDFHDVIDDGSSLVALTDSLDSLFSLYEQGFEEITAILDDQLQPLLTPVLAESAGDADDSLNAAKAWIIVLGVLGLVIGGALAWIVSRRIITSVRRLRNGAHAVADGKLEHRFYTGEKDEFGEVALALNQMLQNIGRSREALGESEETAWQLLDATTDSVMLMDLRGIIQASNEIAAHRFDKSLEQMIDTSYYDLLPADLMASRKAQVAEVIRTGKPLHFEDDRKGMILDTRIFPVINPDNGRVERIAIFARDITTRKWVEDVTERLGRRNELILHAAGEGIYGLDTQGKTTFVNPAAARMLGYKPEDLIGQHHHELVHHSWPNGMPYPPQQCPIHAAFKDGIVRTNVDDDVFWRKDGTSFPVEYTSTPIIEDGTIAGAVVTFRDITERKHVEIALRRSEERYRALFESPATLIISVDAEGIIIDCNARSKGTLGYLPDELVGQSLIRFVHKDYRSLTHEVFKEVLTKGFEYNYRYKMMRKNGTFIDVNMNAASVKNEFGEYIRTICMIETIAEQVQT